MRKTLVFFLAVIVLTSCTGNGGRNFKDVKDLNEEGIVVGTLIGSLNVDRIGKDMPKAEMKAYDNDVDALMALTSGKIDAVATDGFSYSQMAGDYPELTVFEDKWHADKLGMIFNKKETELRTHFNQFLAILRKDGSLKRIIDRWLSYSDTVSMPDLKGIPRKGEPIIAVTTGTATATSFMKKDELCGYDIEIMQRFAAYEKRPIEFLTVNFGGLLAAVSSGKADMGANAITITKERAKQVDFSDPYFISYSILVTRCADVAGYKAKTNGSEKSFIGGIVTSFKKNLITEDRWKILMDGLWQTLLITIFAIIIGTLIAAGVSWMSLCKKRWIRSTAHAYISLLEGIPILVLLMLIFYVVFASVGISPTIVAIVTFSMNFGAYMSETFTSTIQGIDRGQKEAGVAIGFTDSQTFLYIILPQMVQRLMPTYRGRCVSLLKDTSIVGYIAILDLTKASDIIRSRTFEAFFPLIIITIIYFVLAWLLGKVLGLINTTKK